MGREESSQRELVKLFLKGGEINGWAANNRCPAGVVPDLGEPLHRDRVTVNSRWHSLIVEEILGANEVVREVFLEEVAFTLRPEARIGFHQMIRGKICSK